MRAEAALPRHAVIQERRACPRLDTEKTYSLAVAVLDSEHDPLIVTGWTARRTCATVHWVAMADLSWRGALARYGVERLAIGAHRLASRERLPARRTANTSIRCTGGRCRSSSGQTNSSAASSR